MNTNALLLEDQGGGLAVSLSLGIVPPGRGGGGGGGGGGGVIGFEG
jgi:hypothetical protein